MIVKKASNVLVKAPRYSEPTAVKKGGETFTPADFARFLANKIISDFGIDEIKNLKEPLEILDPAAGDGELLLQTAEVLKSLGVNNFRVTGYEINLTHSLHLKNRLEGIIGLNYTIHNTDFISCINNKSLFNEKEAEMKYHLIIANPPYVRTQILGSKLTKTYREMHNLNGRVDLYHVFLANLHYVLADNGVIGIITSNRFLNTKTGEQVRNLILDKYTISRIYDFGDTKLFNAAVLPAVMILKSKDINQKDSIKFTNIYETNEIPKAYSDSIFHKLDEQTIVKTKENKTFKITQGVLKNNILKSSIWVLGNEDRDSWLEQVNENSWKKFKEIGKVKVGVKTCADKVFILPAKSTDKDIEQIEISRDLITHHIAGRYKAKAKPERKIIYPYSQLQNKKVVLDIKHFPNAERYLLLHKKSLESRKYLIDAGREWYELWVPHLPSDWEGNKIVFRDISEKPNFWLDSSGSVVNGDCYWLKPNSDTEFDTLLLSLAVANSTFIEKYYDLKFNNKLYSGRRRFITQYVEEFPIPDPNTGISKEIINLSKQITNSEDDFEQKIEDEIDKLVWQAFGFINQKN